MTNKLMYMYIIIYRARLGHVSIPPPLEISHFIGKKESSDFCGTIASEQCEIIQVAETGTHDLKDCPSKCVLMN